jgi:predicted DNA-binding transcriptional regulator AlpA
MYTSFTMGSEMSIDSLRVRASKSAGVGSERVTLSPWVNEPLFPWADLLSSHDVARLTRRPRWLLHGLALVGRFPKKHCFHGRRVGWLRADVFEWLSRGFATEPGEQRRETPPVPAKKHPRQRCLPLKCLPLPTAPCDGLRRAGSSLRGQDGR